MGTQLSRDTIQSDVAETIRDIAQHVSNVLVQRVPWLDEGTARVVAAIVGTVAAEHPALRAAILYGSVARHEERALTDQAPSDVDLLLLFTPSPNEHDLTFQEHRAVFASIGQGRATEPEPPREIQVLPAADNLANWDEAFVENVAHDGILLLSTGELPSSLEAIRQRTGGPSLPRLSSGL